MPSHVALFCLPCAGASAVMYLRWKRLLPPWIEVIPIELPGRGSRVCEDPQHDYRRLVDLLSQEIQSAAMGNYVLFGHSMGALLAYGVTRQLYRLTGQLPDALLVSGCEAPARQNGERYRKIRTQAALIADLNQQGGTPPEVFNTPELLAMIVDVLRIDYRVCGSFEYVKEELIPVPIHCFGGKSDAIGEDHLDSWRLESSHIFTLDWFDGGHFFLRQSEKEFLQALQKRLLESQKGAVWGHAAMA